MWYRSSIFHLKSNMLFRSHVMALMEKQTSHLLVVRAIFINMNEPLQLAARQQWIRLGFYE